MYAMFVMFYIFDDMCYYLLSGCIQVLFRFDIKYQRAFHNEIEFAYRWTIDDLSMIHRWYITDPSMIYRWSIGDISMIYRWYMDDISMIYRWTIDDLYRKIGSRGITEPSTGRIWMISIQTDTEWKNLLLARLKTWF